MTRNIVDTDSWSDLRAHYGEIRSVHMKQLFETEPDRFERLHLSACGLLLDYSKHRITDATLKLLYRAVRELDLSAAIQMLFDGETVNRTEHRPALHMALRYRGDRAFPRKDFDVMPGVRDVLDRMIRFAGLVRDGSWRGFTGRPITNIVNIGIGGSDLGPKMVVHALRPYTRDTLNGYFVSNLDSGELVDVFERCDPQETLFIIASKTFSTLETLTNARSARQWLISALGDEKAVARHFVAVSTAGDKVREFGIDTENMFEFWDWVGGRYSVWSAIGLSVLLMIGEASFEEFLSGAGAMDEHFRDAPIEANMPVILGILGVWYRNFFETETHAVLAYDAALRFLPDYLQQLEMESNGKRVRHDGADVGLSTCPVIWGGLGNNAQHAFYQLLHQGTTLIPSDFIVPMRLQTALPGHEVAVVSNALAQMEALMCGRSRVEITAALSKTGAQAGGVLEDVSHRQLPGNQPTSCLLYERLTPGILGSLIALYEHKVFVQSVCWGNNPFDQWGVELGKVLATVIADELNDVRSSTHDSSTSALIDRIKRGRLA